MFSSRLWSGSVHIQIKHTLVQVNEHDTVIFHLQDCHVNTVLVTCLELFIDY